MSLCAIILAGGGGTRLWPLSRAYYPKQFLTLFGEHSMLQDTLLRLDGLENEITLMAPLAVCNEEHRFLVASQIDDIGKSFQSIILEPDGRNTAPALTVASIALLEADQDPVMVMMPADHNVGDVEKFQFAIKLAYRMAQDDRLITFGIKPTYPETGYGYIKLGTAIVDDIDAYEIDSFMEKPDAALAETYLKAGHYLWNSGLFMMKASVWRDAIERLQPDIYQACHAAYTQGTKDNQFFRLDKEAFQHCRSDSIDYAVMEKLVSEEASHTAVIPLDAGWSDVGAWSAVWELGQRDNENNVAEGDVILADSSNNLIKSENRLVTALGCNNMVIVETADAIMVADKDKAQNIKEVVGKLNDDQREERLTHRRVYRPWGSYETVDAGERFQVKRLTVYPGKKLSLQLHHQRAEHWVVVNGTATVTKGEEVFKLHENESTYIPIETKHRLENATDSLLELIEVQSGEYLGEDDIVRFEDDFGRK